MTSVVIRLEQPSMRSAEAFLDAVRRSRALHGRWAYPPSTLKQYRAYVQRVRKPTHVSQLVCTADASLAGVININEIVRGSFRSGYLGYYAFVPYDGRGYMREGLGKVIGLAFRKYGLHRLEANIQPDNRRSIALVRRLGFEREGYSPRYLKIAGRWRDHERWALTQEGWKLHRDRERAG
jgi:ribosomal-protein-alanine N-acetyltransferase